MRATTVAHRFDRLAVTPPAQTAGAALPLQALQALEERLDAQRSERSAQALQPPGRGRPLPPAIQAQMEQALGHDFSSVRVHEGPQAESVGALAYTRGTDLHFAPGRYSPATPEGRRILVHELTHVKQQWDGRVPVPPGKGAPINADPALEAEADAMARTVTLGPSPPSAAPTAGTSPGGAARTIQPMESGSAGGAAPATSSRRLEVRSSPIHGKGLFAKAAYNPGDRIEANATARQDADGRKAWEVTPGARYTNHHDAPNARLTTAGDRMVMSADRPIRPDEEVTVDYNEVGRLIGTGRLTWKGKTIPAGDEAETFFRNDRTADTHPIQRATPIQRDRKRGYPDTEWPKEDEGRSPKRKRSRVHKYETRTGKTLTHPEGLPDPPARSGGSMSSLRTLKTGDDPQAPALRGLADVAWSLSNQRGRFFPRPLVRHGPPPTVVGSATARRTGQHQAAMAAATGHRSAQQYSEAIGTAGPVPMEWLHARAHGEGGSDEPVNLAAGGAGANSVMILAETAARHNPQPDRLTNQTVHLVQPGTYQAEVIHQQYVDNKTGRVVYDRVHDAYRAPPTKEEWDQEKAAAAHLADPEMLDAGDLLASFIEAMDEKEDEAGAQQLADAMDTTETTQLLRDLRH